MNLTRNKYYKTFLDPLVGNNPISMQMLGICSALAVTVQMKTALVMGFSMTFVVALSNLTISLMRRYIPHNIRIIVELCVIASLVILADELLKAFFYQTSKQLSVFVGLIITNCIVMGRAEAFALGHTPVMAFMDGLGNGTGYGLVLITVATIRELLGAGKIFGIKVIPQFFYNLGYENMEFMQLAPAAFILIGMLVWLQRTLTKK